MTDSSSVRSASFGTSSSAAFAVVSSAPGGVR
jgi:hypothetical protein